MNSRKNKNNAVNAPQMGGEAPVNARDQNLQPSEAVMKWATTAGVPTPSAEQMRGVAQGGARHKKSRKQKKSRKGKKAQKKTRKNKSRKQKKTRKGKSRKQKRN
jgi:hypothetical protein